MKKTPMPRVEILHGETHVHSERGSNLPVLINAANTRAKSLIATRVYSQLVVNGYNEEGIRVSYHLNTAAISWV